MSRTIRCLLGGTDMKWIVYELLEDGSVRLTGPFETLEKALWYKKETGASGVRLLDEPMNLTE